jgi:hypothetical protein
MLDLAFVRANLPLVEQKLRDRNMDPATTLSAEGATTYQPGPKAQVQHNDRRRAEGPKHQPQRRIHKASPSTR